MPDTITAGRILVREGIELPRGVRLESEPYAAGWRLVKNLDAYGLGRTIHEAGWNFFCQAGDIKAAAFGVNERAIKRILAKVESEKFNSLEITRVANQRFLGVPYASVSARSRHIQESVFLFEAKDHPARDRARPAAA